MGYTDQVHGLALALGFAGFALTVLLARVGVRSVGGIVVISVVCAVVGTLALRVLLPPNLRPRPDAGNFEAPPPSPRGECPPVASCRG